MMKMINVYEDDKRSREMNQFILFGRSGGKKQTNCQQVLTGPKNGNK